MALLGAGCEGDAFNRGYARQLWALASKIQNAINRLSDSETGFKAANSLGDLESVLDDIAANMAAWKFSAGYYADRLTERLRSMAQVQAAAELEEQNSGINGFIKGRIQAALDNTILLPLARIKEVIRPFAAILDRQQQLFDKGVAPHEALLRAFGEQVMTETGMRGVIEGIDGRDMVNREKLGAFEQQAHFVLGALQLASIVLPAAKVGGAAGRGAYTAYNAGERVAGKAYGVKPGAGGKDFLDSRALDKLRAYMKKRHVDVKVGSEAADWFAANRGAIGGFEVPAAGRPTMYLPENPTRYEVWHEMGHYIEYKNIGRAEYMSGFDPFRTAAREGFVWRQLRGPKPGMPGHGRRWAMLNQAEQGHALGNATGCGMTSPFERWNTGR